MGAVAPKSHRRNHIIVFIIVFLETTSVYSSSVLWTRCLFGLHISLLSLFTMKNEPYEQLLFFFKLGQSSLYVP